MSDLDAMESDIGELNDAVYGLVNDEDLENRFLYHPPPNQARIDAHANVSGLCLHLAKRLRDICPPGRNFSLVLTHLEDVRMRANAALACDSPLIAPKAEG